MSGKKYFVLLVTLVVLSSCTTQKEESSAPATNSGTTQIETPVVTEDTPPLPEVPTPQVVPIETPVNTPPSEPTKKEPTSIAPKVIRLSQKYVSPGGDDEIALAITVEGSIIKKVISTTVTASNPKSQGYQSGFAGSINSAVVGKTLEEAKNIDTVSGASLTTGAFKMALKNM